MNTDTEQIRIHLDAGDRRALQALLWSADSKTRADAAHALQELATGVAHADDVEEANDAEVFPQMIVLGVFDSAVGMRVSAEGRDGGPYFALEADAPTLALVEALGKRLDARFGNQFSATLRVAQPKERDGFVSGRLVAIESPSAFAPTAAKARADSATVIRLG